MFDDHEPADQALRVLHAQQLAHHIEARPVDGALGGAEQVPSADGLGVCGVWGDGLFALKLAVCLDGQQG